MSEFINTIDILGDEAVTDSIIDGSITEFKDDEITIIGVNAFNNYASLVSVICPNATVIGGGAFSYCEQLTDVYIGVTSITWYSRILRGCRRLRRVVFPSLAVLSSNNLVDTTIHILDLPVTKTIDSGAFSLSSVEHLLLRNDNGECCAYMEGTNWCPKYVYVPSALIEDYKVATNWSTVANRFRALEDYTVDGTITGDLDETKI